MICPLRSTSKGWVLVVLLLFTNGAEAFTSRPPLRASVRVTPRSSSCLSSTASDDVFDLPFESMKGSLRTYLQFYIIGEFPEAWRADAGDDKNVVIVHKSGAGVNLIMDETRERIRAVRIGDVGAAATAGYQAAEKELLLGLLGEIEGVALNEEVEAEKRLVVVTGDALQYARNKLSGEEQGVEEPGVESEGGEDDAGDDYAKAKAVLTKKSKFEKMLKFRRERAEKNSIN